jgi:hypothetical protein
MIADRDLTARNRVIDALIIVLIGIMLAILGPFGTFETPFSIRLIYWVGLLVAGNLVYLATTHLLIGAATRWHLPEAMVWIGGAVLGSIPMTALVALVNRAAFGMTLKTPDHWLYFYGLVLVISFIITGVMWLVSTRRTAVALSVSPLATLPAEVPVSPAQPAVALAPVSPRLAERLPPGKRGQIWALESEDHYVRVHGDFGSELLLIRLRDAIAEMDGTDGFQVHRSWWVAYAGIAKITQADRNATIELKSGVAAPVARSSVADLEVRGWIRAVCDPIESDRPL